MGSGRGGLFVIRYYCLVWCFVIIVVVIYFVVVGRFFKVINLSIGVFLF